MKTESKLTTNRELLLKYAQDDRINIDSTHLDYYCELKHYKSHLESYISTREHTPITLTDAEYCLLVLTCPYSLLSHLRGVSRRVSLTLKCQAFVWANRNNKPLPTDLAI